MSDGGNPVLTTMLSAAGRGDTQAADQIVPLVYDHLRRVAKSMLAKELPGNTLQPTALVHEAFLRVVGETGDSNWDHRGHFLAAAGQAMRRILVEQARRKATLKRGGDRNRIEIDPLAIEAPSPSEEILALEEALQRLETRDSRKGKIVNLRYFAGLTVEETAAALEVSVGTIEREWRYIKSWIYSELADHDEPLQRRKKTEP